MGCDFGKLFEVKFSALSEVSKLLKEQSYGLTRQICKIAHETDQNIPTYKAVYRIVRELPKDLLVLAHEGTQQEARCRYPLVSCSRCWKDFPS